MEQNSAKFFILYGLFNQYIRSVQQQKLYLLQFLDRIRAHQSHCLPRYGKPARRFPHLDLKVSDLLEKHATPEARTAHIDLADWLIEFLQDNK